MVVGGGAVGLGGNGALSVVSFSSATSAGFSSSGSLAPSNEENSCSGTGDGGASSSCCRSCTPPSERALESSPDSGISKLHSGCKTMGMGRATGALAAADNGSMKGAPSPESDCQRGEGGGVRVARHRPVAALFLRSATLLVGDEHCWVAAWTNIPREHGGIKQHQRR